MNFNLNSLDEEVKKETSNMCLITKGDNCNFYAKNISPPTNDYLLNIYKELHAT